VRDRGDSPVTPVGSGTAPTRTAGRTVPGVAPSLGRPPKADISRANEGHLPRELDESRGFLIAFAPQFTWVAVSEKFLTPRGIWCLSTRRPWSVAAGILQTDEVGSFSVSRIIASGERSPMCNSGARPSTGRSTRLIASETECLLFACRNSSEGIRIEARTTQMNHLRRGRLRK
jgi:hypothetical protein